MKRDERGSAMAARAAPPALARFLFRAALRPALPRRPPPLQGAALPLCTAPGAWSPWRGAHSQQGGDGGGAGPEGGALPSPQGTKFEERFKELSRKLFLDSLLRTASTHNHRFTADEAEAARVRIGDAQRRCFERHREKAVDGLSEFFLQTAALAVEAYKVLHPWVGQEVLFKAMRDLLGELTGGAFGAAQRALLAFQWDKFRHVSKALANLDADYGAYTTIEHHVIPGQRHEAVVTRCLYNTVTREEGVPELMAVFCAVDLLIFENYRVERYGMRFSRPATLAEGQPACRFILEKEGGAGAGEGPREAATALRRAAEHLRRGAGRK